MAFRLLDKTVQNKTFAAPIGVIKAGRNRIGAVGQLDVSTLAKAPGGSFSISWAARNDDIAPGTVGLALLDGSGQLFARTDGVILSPGEERTLNLNVPAEEIADPLAWADEEVWTVAMIAMAWEDAPDPKSGDFTNLAYASPAHTFIINYTDAKQKLFTNQARAAYESAMKDAGFQPDNQIPFAPGWQEMLQNVVSETKRQEADFDAYIAALNEFDVSQTQVPYNYGDWRGAMDTFIVARETRQTKEGNWLADLAANGLSKDDLSFADWQAGMLASVVNDRAQKTAVKKDKDAFMAAWGNFRQEMFEAGFAVAMPNYTSDWQSVLEVEKVEYEDRRAYRAEKSKVLSRNPGLTERGTKDAVVHGGMPEYSSGWRNRLSSWTDKAVEQLESDRALEDKKAFSEARSKAGFSSTDVRYTSNWRSTLSAAQSKRVSDRLRAEAKARQDKIAADAKLARELKAQQDKQADVRRRAILALRQQQTDTSDYEYEHTPASTPQTTVYGDVPSVTTTYSGPTRSGSRESAREANRITPVYVSPFVADEKARVVESSSGNFMTIFDHEATGRDDLADYDDWI